ncbi:MAG TPA: ParB/RepB/Spo0J family partition protein [Acidimicrobiia bacterium]
MPAAAAGGLQEIPLTAIHPNRYQPRQHFDEAALSELADSIHEVGLLQPVLVRADGEGGYELIAGERRWRAARRAGLQSIPALVRTTDDASALEHALVENLHRDDLNPLEEAGAYQQLIEDFELTHEQVAARVGRSRVSVTNMLRLLQLPPAIQRLLSEGRLDAGHARALLGTPDRAFQERLAQRAAEESLTVREVEEAVRRHGETAGNGATERARKGGRMRPPGLLELEELLGEHLETRVRVTMGAKRGRVTIEFSDLEDLERIYRAMTEHAASATD